ATLLQRPLETGPLQRLVPGGLVDHDTLRQLFLLVLVTLHDHLDQALGHVRSQVRRLPLAVVPMEAVASKHQPLPVLVERLDHAGPQRRTLPQGAEEADADETTAGRQAVRTPGEAVDL